MSGPMRRRSSAAVAVAYDQEAIAQDARRYEDFTTIDWVQDTLLERSRRMKDKQDKSDRLRHHARTRSTERQWVRDRSRLGRAYTRGAGWFWRVLEAGESWFILSIVGAAIGLNASIISIITVFLSDLKLGHCSGAWWLNKKFCCWEMEDSCTDWLTWTSWSGIQWGMYVGFAALFAFVCAFLVKSFAPYAAGSGISEIKCILAGFIIKGFLSGKTLVIKSVALPIAIASGLSVGKEGPSVHVACSIGHFIAARFTRFSRSQAKMREVVTAASAAGVAVAFGSPIGGVLFSLEEMTMNYPIKTMWRSFFCALVATVVLSAMNPFRTGKLVLFQVHFDRDWHFFELGFFVIIGIFGGLYGAFVIKYNLLIQSFRKKHLANAGISEAVILAVLTASVGFMNKFLRIDMNESLEILFRECEAKGGDYEGLCQTWAQWRMINSLLLATVLRTVLVVISYGSKVPAGIFVPSMAVGATFGRMVGILVKGMYRAHPDWAMFSTCDPTKPCITPGTYAFLGAAAGLAGITRITVTVVVIMFELTGALTYILPTMIVVMVTKAVSDQFGRGGIADQMIRFNGFPLLEHEDVAFNIPVAPVMTNKVVTLPSRGMRLDELETLLKSCSYQGFPVVRSRKDLTLLGDIARSDLLFAIEKAQRTSLIEVDAQCLFCPEQETVPVGNATFMSPEGSEGDLEGEEASGEIDFTFYVNQAPITVSPKQPLEIVMQIFKKMGPRAILIEQYGLLQGLITVKDCLKYTISHEASSVFTPGRSPGAGVEELEQTLEELGLWVREVWQGIKSRIVGRRGVAREEEASEGETETEDEGVPLTRRDGVETG